MNLNPQQRYDLVLRVSDRAGVETTVACECLIQAGWNRLKATEAAKALSHMTVETALMVLDGTADEGEDE